MHNSPTSPPTSPLQPVVELKESTGKRKKKFETQNYMVVYEELMKVQEARENFHSFLKLAHNEEPILFLDSLDSYRIEHRKLKESLINMTSVSSSDLLDSHQSVKKFTTLF